MPVTPHLLRIVAAAALALTAACAAPIAPAPVPTPAPPPAPAAGLPPIPEADGALEIRVVHPTPATPKPAVARSFVFGSVGSGRATLTIDGVPVPVAPNGAFLAYLPVPASGAYELVATRERQSVRAIAAYQAPSPPAAPPATPAAPVTTVEFARPLGARVTRGADTLATGSDAAIGRPTPTGTYRWFLPRGANVEVTGRRGTQLRARLGGQDAWFDAADLALGDTLRSTAPVPVSGVRLSSAARWVDLRLAAGGAPFLLETDTAGRTLAITLHGAAPPAAPSSLAGEPFLAGAEWDAPEAGSARLRLRFNSRLWGYKAWYDSDGALIVRLRRPPRIDPANPLRGIRIAIDPGHPPAGATGPTGMTEAEANLNIALPLARQLRERGAEVLLTRDANVSVALGDRTALAAAWDADLLVSVHNNAFAEGANPFAENGTSTYYFYPFSRDLARALDAEIAATTRIRDLGAKSSNLALVRITWMPSTLTESLFMMIPEQESALRDPAFLERLAAAHVRGIARFLGEAGAGR